MATHVQVILRDTLPHLGKPGDVVRVKPGYARNYLLPRGLAFRATVGDVKRIEEQRAAAVRHAAKVRKAAEGIAAALEAVELSLEQKAGENGRLYGSVTAADVATLLTSKGYEVSKKQVSFPEGSIRELGSYDIELALAPEVVGKVKLNVVEPTN